MVRVGVGCRVRCRLDGLRVRVRVRITCRPVVSWA